jgi:hypothetical protein
LVNASQRDAVRENPPEDGEEGAEAFIRFAGEVSISLGEGIIAWLAVPIIPLVFLIIGRVNVDISNQVASIEDSESE